MKVTATICKTQDNITHRRSLLLFCGSLESHGLYGFSQFWSHIAQWVLENWKHRLTLCFLLCFLPLFFLLSLLPFPCYLFPFSLLLPKRIAENFVFSWDGDLLSCSLCLFLSFWSGISQPVLLSWNRRESSCSKQEQKCHRQQNSWNASIFRIDSDWKTGLKYSWDHEDTQVWGAWCGSVWLHSPWVEEIQSHIQVMLLPLI